MRKTKGPLNHAKEGRQAQFPSHDTLKFQYRQKVSFFLKGNNKSFKPGREMARSQVLINGRAYYSRGREIPLYPNEIRGAWGVKFQLTRPEKPH